MSEKGKQRAMDKAKLPTDGGMFEVSEVEQRQRRAAQAFLKMLRRDPRRVEDSFVAWVKDRAFIECGSLYPLVRGQCEKRLAKNAQMEASQRASKENEYARLSSYWVHRRRLLNDPGSDDDIPV
jgi:hypothetical protein